MPSTAAALLEQLRLSATSERDKGDKFERLVRRFLTVETAWAARFSQVYLWMDWPGRGHKPDRGIDLVAIERDSGATVAIQCKFYEPGHYLPKEGVDSFLAESGKHPFTSRLIVSTTENWSRAAEAAIKDQQVPVSRIGLSDLIESSVDWTEFSFAAPDQLTLKPRKTLRPHQVTAVAQVKAGFGERDRGKLIMACGTGKTFTSLRLAEDLVGTGGSVLFLVPSIALLSQSLREWSIEADVDLRVFAVCSDAKVGKGRGNFGEDISVVDLEIPANTDPSRLVAQVGRNLEVGQNRMTVVFSTYQSIDVIRRAQALGLGRFDLVICDEAHRTTGATLQGSDESAFVRVHDNDYIDAARRLYMTATPRIYDDASKAKAGQAEVLLASMDDDALYGPEFHRLDFGEAVGQGLLSDYRVLILTVPETAVSSVMQSALAVDSELNLPDAAKIIGCWNGLSKRGDPDCDFPSDPAAMRRAVAFCQSIKTSQVFAAEFSDVVDHYVDVLAAAGEDTGPDYWHPVGRLDQLRTGSGSDPGTGPDADNDAAGTPLLTPEVHHVDGTMNILTRNAALDWLRAEPGPGHCRILTNARCLAEGVDVPALDAVIFLNPRRSEVDVVQAVGRVMRQAPGKKYGYIILPIGVPAGEKPDVALRKNERYAVVWRVLQALRAHDSRFNAMINQIELNHTLPEQIKVIGVDVPDPAAKAADSTDAVVQAMLPMNWDEWRDAIFAKIVDKVGSRRYWEDWAKDVADIVSAHTTRLTDLVDHGNGLVKAAFGAFLEALRANLNPSIDAVQAIDMLSQHMITKPVFDALFDGYSFTAHNPVAQVMQSMLAALEGQNLEAETAALDKFYESVRIRVQGIDNAEGKQRVLMELYEKFFRLAFKKISESLGIVYTPVEIVDFIIRAVDDLLHEHFGMSISDQGVHVLDPFTGTGTFIVRLLESGLIGPADLARKYASELHANEILLLAYYIAAANIEVTYHSLADQADGDYTPFEGIVLTDTFQMTEVGDTLDDSVFVANNDRAARQLRLLGEHRIEVILGNPPYSVGQTSGNDNNQNLKYPTLDDRIEETYAARSTATNKNSLYDSYIRAIRWASDRLGDQGIVAYVSNGGYIDGNTADGLRQCLIDEFACIYVYNLRGAARGSGEPRKMEAENVFGSGSRTSVAIILLIKNAGATRSAELYYRNIGDYLTREQKLNTIAGSTLESVPWETLTPNREGDWINLRNDMFDHYQPIGDKTNAPGQNSTLRHDSVQRESALQYAGSSVFTAFSRGLATGRDTWVYGFSQAELRANAERMIDFYNGQVAAMQRAVAAGQVHDPKSDARAFVANDSSQISWNRADYQHLARGDTYAFDGACVRIGSYRPFCHQWVYFSRQVNDMVYRQFELFPTPTLANIGFTLTGVASHYEFSVIATDMLPDLHLLDTGQFFARWRYEPVKSTVGGRQGVLSFGESDCVVVDGFRRIDNITDAALSDYQAAFGPQVTKDDVFHYVYGLLHSPDYRRQFAADLKKMLPRIPLVDTRQTFEAFVTAGQALLDLHVGYEQVRPWPGLVITGDEPQGDPDTWYQVSKMSYGNIGREKDKTVIQLNPHITVSGIPLEAQAYQLGPRSALD